MAYSYTDNSVTPSQAGIQAQGAAGSFNYSGPNIALGAGQRSAAFWASREPAQWGYGMETAAPGGLGLAAVAGLAVVALLIIKRKA